LLRYWVLGAFAAATSTAPLIAQTAEPPPPVQATLKAPDAVCELHVWPGPDLKSVIETFMRVKRVNEDFDPARNGTRPDALSTARQNELLTAADLPSKFGLSSYRLVVHPEAMSRAASASRDRHSDARTPCYAEFMVGQLIYEKGGLTGKSLALLGVFRRFDGPGPANSSFTTFVRAPLAIFPASSADGWPSALAEIDSAYRKNVIDFADLTMHSGKGR
jgi:hypothetical protein